MFEVFGIPSQALFGQLLLGLINGSFYALLSLGLAVIFGMLNIINFTHGAQYMMGAFAAFLLLRYAGIGYWPALLLAPLGMALAAAALRRYPYGNEARQMQFAAPTFCLLAGLGAAWLLHAIPWCRARRSAAARITRRSSNSSSAASPTPRTAAAS